jgi:hypothetical protein
LKTPPRSTWPKAGALIKVVRLDGTGAGLRRFRGILYRSLVTNGVNSDQLAAVSLEEISSFEELRPDGKPGTTWG